MPAPGSLRIIAGALRGRRVRVARGAAVRPTAERAREALFSILADRVPGARVLDAYCGTGALGFEALSRGAARVVMLEADPASLRALGENVGRLGVAARCRVVGGRALDLLRSGAVRGPFELILADPPYASDERERFLPLAAESLEAGGVIVLERDARSEPAEAPLAAERYRSARYGRCCLDFYRGLG